MCTSCINYTCLRTQNFAYFDYGSGAVINQIKPELKILKKKKTGYSCLPKSIKFTVLFARRFAFDFSYSIFSEI